MSHKFDADRLFRDAAAVAALVPASKVFSLLVRSLDLPAGWAALIADPEGGQQVRPPGAVVPKDNVDEILFVRTTPVEIRLAEEECLSKDKYQCLADVGLRVSLIPERGELVSFRKAVLGSSRTADAAVLARYLQPHVRSVLVRLAAGAKAASLIDGKRRDACLEALRDALQAPCFTAGMVLEDPVAVRFDSPTYRQVRLSEEQAIKQRAEHQARRHLEQAIETAQKGHLEHLETLLTRLKQAAADSPEVDLPALMRTFSNSERGELYEALFAAEPVQASTRWIVVAAGPQLLFFDPRSPGDRVRTVEVTGDIGPVRSVQTLPATDGTPRLWVGASRGVYEFALDGAEPLTVFRADPKAKVVGGVNAAAVAGNRVWASHSELGLLCWERARPDWAVSVLEPHTRDARAVRNVRFFNGRIYCSIDDRVVSLPADDLSADPLWCRGSDSVITSLTVGAEGLFAGNAEGRLLHWPGGRRDAPEVLHAGSRRPAESVWLLPAGGVNRLFFVDTSLAVYARVLGDTFTCRYEAGGQTIRRVEVAPDCVVGTNDIRDRLFCWSPTNPAQPAAVIPVARLCRHSVQDVCLAPFT